MRQLLAIAFIAYPLAVLLSPEWLPRPVLIALFGALASARVLLFKPATPGQRVGIVCGIAAFCGMAVAEPGLTVLKTYPVLLSLAGAGYGLYTLRFPPSAIERLARATGMHMDETGQRYTRGVTRLWVAFFVCNGAIAGYTALFSSTATWTLYNGLLSYLLIGLLFALEYGYRGHYRKRHGVSS